MKIFSASTISKYFVILAIISIAVALTHPSAGAITLQEAKQEALRVNLDIKIAREKVLEAQSLRKERYAAMFASVGVFGNLSHKDIGPRVDVDMGEYGTYSGTGPIPSRDIEVLIGERDTYKVYLQLNQPIFTGGRLYYSYRQAGAREKGSEWERAQAVEDVLFNTEWAYISLLKAEEMKSLAEDHERTMQAHMAAMELKYEKGRVALNDLLKVKAEVARAREEVIKADNALVIARGQLNLLLNRPFDQPIEVVPVEAPDPLNSTLDEVEKIALANRLDLKYAHAQLEEFLYNRRVAESGYYPDFKFLAEYVRQTDQPTIEPENWSVMLLMEYPLWEWGRTGHKVSAARAVERQGAYYIEALKNRIAADVRQAWFGIKEADTRIEVSREALAQAEENLRIVRFGFDKGLKTSTDVLEAEELYSKTSKEYLQARYDAHLARAALRHSMGLMREEDIEF